MIIETKRLILKRLSLDMAYDIHINSLDEDNRFFVPDEVFETVDEAREAIKYLMGQYDNNTGPKLYAIFTKDNKNIGYVQLVPIDDNEWEIGYHIAKPYTKCGYASEAVSEFITYVFKELNVNRIYGIALKDNISSIKVLEKCGFKKIFDGVGLYQGENKNIVKYMINNLEILCNIKNKLGEGPIYDYKNNSISFVDIVGKKLCILDKDNNLKEIEFAEKIGAAIPYGDGSYLVCCETKLFIYSDSEIKEYKSLDSIIDNGMRCNDAKADKSGRLYFSTMVDDGINKPHGGLYYLNNGEIVCLDNNVKLGNGLAWNKDNNKFYYADSVEHKVFVYDYDEVTGLVSNKKVLFEITNGSPDGMTIDNNDNLFVAVWGGSRIEVRSSKDGKLLDVISVPTRLVTSCAFCGDEFDKLVITTAKLEEADEYAGSVFVGKTKYKGREENYAK